MARITISYFQDSIRSVSILSLNNGDSFLKSDLVSILIPVYNRELLIEETINSALAQTYKNIEVIVVDNQSTDNTWAIITKMAATDNRIKPIRNNENMGPVRNWSRCINEASGVFGKILWSDDLISPNFVEKCVDILKSNDEVGFVYSAVEIFNDSKKTKNIVYINTKSENLNSEVYIHRALFDGGVPVSPGCALFRLKDLKRNLLIDVPNKVNSDFAMHAIGNDLLIFLLTANQYRYFYVLNEVLSFFRAHDGSISESSDVGKLLLHYALAQAYFVENYRMDLIKKFNSKLYLLILKFKNIASNYSLDKISNYYIKTNNLKLDYLYFIKKIVNKVLALTFKK